MQVQQNDKLSPPRAHPLTGCGTKLGNCTSISCSLVFTAPCKQTPRADRCIRRMTAAWLSCCVGRQLTPLARTALCTSKAMFSSTSACTIGICQGQAYLDLCSFLQKMHGSNAWPVGAHRLECKHMQPHFETPMIEDAAGPAAAD